MCAWVCVCGVYHPLEMPRRKRDPRSHWSKGACAEDAWVDGRTGIRMAPGAVQNWPTPTEEKYIRSTHRLVAEVRRQPAFVTVIF